MTYFWDFLWKNFCHHLITNHKFDYFINDLLLIFLPQSVHHRWAIFSLPLFPSWTQLRNQVERLWATLWMGAIRLLVASTPWPVSVSRCWHPIFGIFCIIHHPCIIWGPRPDETAWIRVSGCRIMDTLLQLSVRTVPTLLFLLNINPCGIRALEYNSPPFWKRP